MARGHSDLPSTSAPIRLEKSKIFAALARIDASSAARDRVLRMECDFRRRIDSHISALPASSAEFRKFNTSPFVLMFYSRQQGYHHVSQIEKDIIPAKVFSSMETSAGRMVETVALPVYGWQAVPSTMHSVESVIDGCKETNDGTFMAATLKSGPRCLNDEMAKDIGVDVVTHARSWATNHNSQAVEFTYGVLYGTKRQSNKKDWHILRNMGQVLPSSVELTESWKNRWSLRYKDDDLVVSATVRVGIEWWDYLGDRDTWLEICVSLIRACVLPANPEASTPNYAIFDLASIIDTSCLPDDYNVSLLQRSQLEWLLFLSRHFCDELVP
ncbi:MAG: hypothetical protein CTY15_08535 [Methylocystis sp.]|nr:MAG: hypothetical protein CTY15_08535 [Methylocystis sp.]